MPRSAAPGTSRDTPGKHHPQRSRHIPSSVKDTLFVTYLDTTPLSFFGRCEPGGTWTTYSTPFHVPLNRTLLTYAGATGLTDSALVRHDY